MPLHKRTAALLVLMTACAVGACTASAQSETMTAGQEAFFEKNIRPALVTYCYECHSLESGTTRGGLLVDTREGLLTGGDSGPAITPGHLDENLLWDAINWDGYEMPPSQKMPANVIADFKKWIEMGAPDPRVRERAVFTSKITREDILAGKEHWAFQPVKANRTDTIDGLIEKRLAEERLEPVDSADAVTLLRRLNFDLVGLPPTPRDVREFKTAYSRDRETAIENKVNELLASDRFGERWGRHWLDVARYADSSGDINVAYPHAWRYRDYVIDAFNDDTPYDQFIREQIAGDLLPASTDEQWQENLIATGFLAIGMKRHGERNPKKFQMDMIDEQIDTVTQSILGVTVACARCHDHKSDPIPTADYYAMAGIFMSTNTLYGTTWGQQNHRPSDLILLPILDKPTKADESIAELNAQLERLRAEQRRMSAEARATGERKQNQFVQMRNRMAAIEGKIAEMNPDGTKKTFGMGVQEGKTLVNASILLGGEVERPAQEVSRGFLSVLDHVPHDKIKPNSSGRRELAEWLTAPENPLTARVMVNRIWSHLFGSPIVSSPNNWGPTGTEPTHPELLDLLASKFVEQGWSMKSMIRTIVLTDAYQRDSTVDNHNLDVDPDNQFFWRMSPRQLDAEVMRDAMLVAGGNLDLARPRSIVGDNGNGRVDRGPGSDTRFEELDDHRSIYLPVIRDSVHESLDLFGFPDPNSTSEGRRESIVPTQALYLLNGEFSIQQARLMAERMARVARDTKSQIEWAFLTAYGREATDREIAASERFIATMTREANPAATEPSLPRVIPNQRATPERRGTMRPNGARPNGARPNGARPNGGRPNAAQGSSDQRRGMRTGQGPRRQQGDMRPRDSRARGSVAGRGGAEASTRQVSADQAAKLLFCQSLIASAEFRIVD